MDMAQLTAVFGWMTLINLGVYLLSAGLIVFARAWIVRLQSRITGVPAEAWPGIYVDFLGRYKLAILLFNLAPWLALLVPESLAPSEPGGIGIICVTGWLRFLGHTKVDEVVF